MITIDNVTHKSLAYDERIKFLVIHYTERNLEISLELLKDTVSVHYLISDKNPDHIFQLIDESKRARHAGASSWQEYNNLNDTSIGIEIVHPGFKKNKNGEIAWLPYDQKQIESLIELCKDIISRYKIHPTCVVGHSDIAPNRKQDPGPLFPWKQLYDYGIGAWYEEEKVDEFVTGDVRRHCEEQSDVAISDPSALPCHPRFERDPEHHFSKLYSETFLDSRLRGNDNPSCHATTTILPSNDSNFKLILTSADITKVQEKFKQYGYQIDITGIFDEQTQNVVKAFQMHFRPQDFSGVLDVETIGVLEALVERYC